MLLIDLTTSSKTCFKILIDMNDACILFTLVLCFHCHHYHINIPSHVMLNSVPLILTAKSTISYLFSLQCQDSAQSSLHVKRKQGTLCWKWNLHKDTSFIHLHKSQLVGMLQFLPSASSVASAAFITHHYFRNVLVKG